ncbi:MAG: ATP-binding protein [Candidatus Gracilibacteria bacterium]|nr:ATP-binding protein [Candidatus Gracilibacteria bacterium]
MQEVCIKLDDNFVSIKKILQKISLEEKAEICFSYISDFRSAKILRDCVNEICNLLGVDSTPKNRLILVIDELNNNAMEYGSLFGETNNMYFCFDKNIDSLLIKVEVEDTGNGYETKKAKDMEIIREENKKRNFSYHKSIRGRGLGLITEKIVDRLYFKDSASGGLIVGIEMKIKK